MIKSADDIYKDLARLQQMYTGNVVETITTYSVKNRQVDLIIEKTPSGNSYRYNVKMADNNTGEVSSTEILFVAYPSKGVDYGIIIGNNNNHVYYNNSGIQKNLKEILKAIARHYNTVVCKHM